MMQEIGLGMNFHLFTNRMKLMKQLRNASYFLAKLEPQKAILLSYEIFQTHLMHLNLGDQHSQLEYID